MEILTNIEMSYTGSEDVLRDLFSPLESQGVSRVDILRDAAAGTAIVHLWWDSSAAAERFERTAWTQWSKTIAEASGGRRPDIRRVSVLDVGKPFVEIANEQLVRRANEAFTRKDLEGVLACYADDAVQYEPFIASPIAGKGQLREYFEGSFDYFPDESIEIQQLISDGPWVVGKWRCRGTHSGDFLGMPATQRPFDVPEATIYEIRNGLIQNLWVYVDSGTIARQFGYRFAPDLG